MPSTYLVANWKMNLTTTEGKTLIQELRHTYTTLPKNKTANTILCPPFTMLTTARDLLADSGLHLGAQNLFHEPKGAFTGEISPAMLAELVNYVIIGHSERRQLFHETDEVIRQKFYAALSIGLTPILCVGEPSPERKEGRAGEYITHQLTNTFHTEKEIATSRQHPFLIAYEPIWAIGSGQPATPDQTEEIATTIQQTLSTLLGDETAQKTPILYGGSTNASNLSDFIQQPHINGALVGGASLKATEFSAMMEKTSQI